jgi:hypothetical protein
MTCIYTDLVGGRQTAESAFLVPRFEPLPTNGSESFTVAGRIMSHTTNRNICNHSNEGSQLAGVPVGCGLNGNVLTDILRCLRRSILRAPQSPASPPGLPWCRRFAPGSDILFPQCQDCGSGASKRRHQGSPGREAGVEGGWITKRRRCGTRINA